MVENEKDKTKMTTKIKKAHENGIVIYDLDEFKVHWLKEYKEILP